MASTIPSLSVSGWENNPTMKMSMIYNYAQASLASQANTYKNKVMSLKTAIISDGDIFDVKNKIQETLAEIYGNYFPIVDVEVTIDETSDNIAYSANISVIDENKAQHVLNVSSAKLNSALLRYDELQDKLREY